MSVTSIQTARPSRRIGAWTLQGILATAFLAAGVAKLTGAPFMVDLFAQIGVGQWFRFVTGAVATHVFILHTSPVAAIVLGLLNAVVVYLRRDELAAFLRRVTA